MASPIHAFRFLLDTNAVSDLVRNPSGLIAAQIAQVGAAAVCINIIVAGELRFGAKKKASPRLTAQVEKVLSGCEILPMDSPIENEYAAIRNALERKGEPIGPNDLWIASHARSANLIFVTDDVREFARVPDLQVENWLNPVVGRS